MIAHDNITSRPTLKPNPSPLLCGCLIVTLGLLVLAMAFCGCGDDGLFAPSDKPLEQGDPFWSQLGLNVHLVIDSPLGGIGEQLDRVAAWGFRDVRTTVYLDEPDAFDKWDLFLAEAGRRSIRTLVVFNVAAGWDCGLGVLPHMAAFIARFDSRDISGYELLNEVEDICEPEKAIGFAIAAEKLLRLGTSRPLAPASTMPMTQDFPRRLVWNEALVRAGAFPDGTFMSAHFYGAQWEKFAVIGPFLNRKVPVPIWLTEFGEKDPGSQLAYLSQVARLWSRWLGPDGMAFWYDFYEAEGPYGLARLGPDGEVVFSDLAAYLDQHPIRK